MKKRVLFQLQTSAYLNTNIRHFLLSCSQTKNQPSLSNLELGFYKSDLEFIKWNLDTSFTSSILDYSATVEKFYTDSIHIIVTDSSSIPFSTKIEGKGSSNRSPP